MDRRHDALSAAAEAVLALERLASQGGGVSNTGRIEAQPGALNVVPGHVRIWVELRSIDGRWLDEQHARFEDAAREAGRKRGVSVAVELLSRTEPVITSDVVRSAMRTAIEGLGLRFLQVPSGAGHDTGHMARLGPVGMLFVPSAGGRSHTPEEWTAPEQLESGTAALLATLLALDRQ
jgi:N-carbamoyl-L-amino-acid hydrolase